MICVRGHFGLKFIFLEVWRNPFLHGKSPPFKQGDLKLVGHYYYITIIFDLHRF